MTELEQAEQDLKQAQARVDELRKRAELKAKLEERDRLPKPDQLVLVSLDGDSWTPIYGKWVCRWRHLKNWKPHPTHIHWETWTGEGELPKGPVLVRARGGGVFYEKDSNDIRWNILDTEGDVVEFSRLEGQV